MTQKNDAGGRRKPAKPDKTQRCTHCGMDLPATHLGRAIRRHGFTYSTFAEYFGIPRPTLAGWASVGYMPHERYRQLLCDAVGVTIEQLRKPFADGRYDEPETHKEKS